jgi:hypothetical protein
MFTDFSSLLNAVKELGIDPRDLLKALDQGVEVTSEAHYVAAPNGFYDVLSSGHIARVLLHIGVGEPARCHDDPQRWHRYHISKCAAYGPPSRQLKSFKTRRADGRFSYFIYDTWGDEYMPQHRENGRKLLICGNCRNKLNHLALDNPDGDLELSSFLQGSLARRLFPNPFRYDHDRVIGFPLEDWDAIARYTKERASWHCARCGWDHRNTPKFLHAHFVETPGIPEAIGQIQVLCVGCHALEPNHSHIHPAIPAFKERFPDHSSLRR